MRSRRVRNSAEAACGEEGRRWLNRFRMPVLVGGMRRTRRPLKGCKWKYDEETKCDVVELSIHKKCLNRSGMDQIFGLEVRRCMLNAKDIR